MIGNAPTLSYSDFSEDFHLYCYASENTLSAILTQPDKDNTKAPIAFMSIPLNKHELKYSLIEKNAYALVRVVKQFIFYILNSHSKAFVLDLAVKMLLTQQEIGVNKRASWIAKVQEYDLNIKHTKLVRGKGLYKAIVEGSFKDEEEMDEEMPLVLFIGNVDDWFSNIAYFLTYGERPDHLSPKEKRTLKLKSMKYVI